MRVVKKREKEKKSNMERERAVKRKEKAKKKGVEYAEGTSQDYRKAYKSWDEPSNIREMKSSPF